MFSCCLRLSPAVSPRHPPRLTRHHTLTRGSGSSRPRQEGLDRERERNDRAREERAGREHNWTERNQTRAAPGELRPLYGGQDGRSQRQEERAPHSKNFSPSEGYPSLSELPARSPPAGWQMQQSIGQGYGGGTPSQPPHEMATAAAATATATVSPQALHQWQLQQQQQQQPQYGMYHMPQAPYGYAPAPQWSTVPMDQQYYKNQQMHMQQEAFYHQQQQEMHLQQQRSGQMYSMSRVHQPMQTEADLHREFADKDAQNAARKAQPESPVKQDASMPQFQNDLQPMRYQQPSSGGTAGDMAPPPPLPVPGMKRTASSPLERDQSSAISTPRAPTQGAQLNTQQDLRPQAPMQAPLMQPQGPPMGSKGAPHMIVTYPQLLELEGEEALFPMTPMGFPLLEDTLMFPAGGKITEDPIRVGDSRWAKSCEAVTVRLSNPKNTETFKLNEVYHSVKMAARNKGYADTAVQDSLPTGGMTGPWTITIAAAFAHDLIMDGEMDIYSSAEDGPNVEVEVYLLTPTGGRYRDPSDMRAGRSAGLARRGNQLERNARRILMYTGFPDTYARKSLARKAEIIEAIKTRITNVITSHGGEIGFDDCKDEQDLTEQKIIVFIHHPEGVSKAHFIANVFPELKFIDVDEPKMCKSKLHSKEIKETSIKQCCFRTQCAPTAKDPTSCGAEERAYKSRNGPPRAEKIEARQRKDRERAEARKVALEHYDKKQKLAEAIKECRAHTKGRCRFAQEENPICSHFTPAQDIMCCSSRGPDHPEHKPRDKCPFGAAGQKCPYKGHVDRDPQ